VLAEGRQVGIHAVITADRPGAVAPALASLIGRRLILRQVDERVYVELGVPAARSRGLELGPGRGLLDAGLLVQVACVSGPNTDGAAQAAQLASLARRGSDAGVPPPLHSSPLREAEPLPAPASASGGTNGGPSARRAPAILGVADVTHEPVAVDLLDGHLLVAGPWKSGRTTALRALLASLPRDSDAYLAGPVSSPLRRDGVAGRSGFGDTAVAEIAGELAQLATAYPDLPRLLFLDDADRLLEDPALAAALDPLARAESVRIVASVETSSLISGYYASALMQRLKKVRRRLLLQPLDDGETFAILGARFPIRPGLAMQPGRGILLAGRSPVVVQVGLPQVDLERLPANGAKGGNGTPRTAPQLRAARRIG